MSITLNRDAFNKLMDEDIMWLLNQPRTLERDHIEQILKWVKNNKKELDNARPKSDTKRY